MKPVSSDDVFALMDAYVTSTALNAAFELGLFWLLDDQPLDTSGIAQALDIPVNRCQYWMQILSKSGLIEMGQDGYAPTRVAQTAILDAFSRKTWDYLAGETHKNYPALHNLAARMRTAEPVRGTGESDPDDYFSEISQDPEKAQRFTRMLYEIHLPLAEVGADALDLNGVARMIDLGGGSGVISQALLRRNPQMMAMVVDVANVCAAGREIAAENSMAERLTFHAANFLQDELPSGFDLALVCDVGIFSADFFRNIRAALNPGGCLVIVDQFAPTPGVAPSAWLDWAFIASLDDPTFSLQTVDEVKDMLREAGFHVLADRPLPAADVQRWSKDWVLLEAQT